MRIWCSLVCIHKKQTVYLRYSRINLRFAHKICLCLGVRAWINMPYNENFPRWIRKAPEHLKTQEMCNKAVADFSCALKYVPDHLKTQEMCSQAVSNNPYMLGYVPDHLKTQKMCDKAIEIESFLLGCVPDSYRTERGNWKRCLKKQLKKNHRA